MIGLGLASSKTSDKGAIRPVGNLLSDSSYLLRRAFWLCELMEGMIKGKREVTARSGPNLRKLFVTVTRNALYNTWNLPAPLAKGPLSFERGGVANFEEPVHSRETAWLST
jgi:hypothetical protein